MLPLLDDDRLQHRMWSKEILTMPHIIIHYLPELDEPERSEGKKNPLRIIGIKLGRSPNGVRAKASEKGISLRRTNQSP